MKSESKIRDSFNSKYGDYLPISIQGNLWAEPIEILLNHEEVEVSQVYEFIDKIDTGKEAVRGKFQEILSTVFKDIQVDFRELGEGAADDGGELNEKIDNLSLEKLALEKQL